MTATSIGIIADAAAAANPGRAGGARQRPASPRASGEIEFRTLIDAASRASSALSSDASPSGLAAGGRKAHGRIAAENPRDAAYRKLGAVFLQKTLETMLPEQGGLVAGKGAAASIWKSMLAQHLADAMSASVFQQSPAPENISTGLPRVASEQNHG